jgi:MoaA/NifB/PqqE/SkfB family radical SAM enzyme
MTLKPTMYKADQKAEGISHVMDFDTQEVDWHDDLLALPLWEPPLVKGAQKYIIGSIIKIHILFIAFWKYLNPFSVIKVLKSLRNLQRQYLGDYKIDKLFKIQGRYYWDMHAPGWPSKAFIKYNEGEMNRIIQFRPIHDYLNSMIFAITKKCMLNCEHCYEWNVINKSEKLTRADLTSIVERFQQRGKGVAQIQFSGGEPMLRYKDILHVLKSAKKDTDFWIVTSGYYLTLEKALALKKAGLRGFAFSLDHFNKLNHNKFRGSHESYDWIMTAINNAHQANLGVILSLCVTKHFMSKENLMEYARLAKRLGASFILLIEPRSVGRYADFDVGLSREQEVELEDFYLKLNFDKAYSTYPAVSYHGYHQRRVGCFGGTNRYVYVNTDGELQVCPFCQKTYGEVLLLDKQNVGLPIMNRGCQPFKQAFI